MLLAEYPILIAGTAILQNGNWGVQKLSPKRDVGSSLIREPTPIPGAMEKLITGR